jgi:trehalose synthase
LALTRDVPVGVGSIGRFASVVGAEHVRTASEMAAALHETLGDRVIWNINSTAGGGGVAEMLRPLVSYGRGLGLDSRWVVISGDAKFFRVTKRLHNALHGARGDGTRLGKQARCEYERVLRDNAAELEGRVRAGDIVYLHDPQTAGLIPRLKELGALAVWRCHIGHDQSNSEVESGWAFLRPYLDEVPKAIFSRASYVPSFLNDGRSVIIPPNIDPFSPKNCDLDAATVRSVLAHAGIVAGSSDSDQRRFVRTDGSPARVERRAQITRTGQSPAWEVPLIVQVSRWDRLKDPVGVMKGFAKFTRETLAEGTELILAGPQEGSVSDDPEGAGVLDEVTNTWKRLPKTVRDRVHIVMLPMADREENAAIVNALQRHAAVIVQKSLHEGFGLTVTEAMWKARPVIASAVGGIQDQIRHRVDGVLLHDPRDLDEFAAALKWVFEDPQRAEQLAENARERARDEYLGLRSLIRHGRIMLELRG